jgi:hypothetical protein
MLASLLRRLGAFWHRVKTWAQPAKRHRPVQPSRPTRYRVAYVPEEPDHFEPWTVYALGEDGHLWALAFACPCGCGASVALNLLPDDEPCWSFEDESGVPTIRPSVERHTGCRSHYFITRGQLRWVGGRGHGDARTQVRRYDRS